MGNDIHDIKAQLWKTADHLRANSPLSSHEYSEPVLGLLFLRYATARLEVVEAEFAEQQASSSRRRQREPSPDDFHARGVMWIPPEARFDALLNLPEGDNLGKAINDAMRTIEAENRDLAGVLPRNYTKLDDDTLTELLRLLNPLDSVEGDFFGKVYEYFLEKFALQEGRGGGEFFTPTSIVKLIVEIIEPFHGRLLDPASGTAGMAVQSAKFVEAHQRSATEISIYGQEKTEGNLRLSKMNLAIHGLSGDIRQANTYYEDLHKSVGRFDFVMANPPFNVDGVDKDRIANDPRFRWGLPNTDNANYLWIEIFAAALSERGRAGCVMANSAADARHSEQAIRQKLLEDHLVDVIVAVGPNFFYSVTLPVTLWFLDRAKADTDRAHKVLFVDARHLYRQIDRAHRDWTDPQIEFLANITRLHRGEAPEHARDSTDLMDEHFPEGEYRDVPGLCAVATLDEIEAHGWSLNPGRYVGVADGEPEDFEFAERLEELNEELEALTAQAHGLETVIAENVATLIEGTA